MYQYIYIIVYIYIYIYIYIIFPYYLDVYLLYIYIYAWFCDRITKATGGSNAVVWIEAQFLANTLEVLILRYLEICSCFHLLSDWILSPICFGENQGFHCRLVRSPAAVFRKKNKRMPSREMMSRPSAVPVRFPMGFWGILMMGSAQTGVLYSKRLDDCHLGFWNVASGKSMDIPIDDTWGFSDDFSWIQLPSGRRTLGVHKSYQMRPKKRERWEIKWSFSGSRYGC